MSSSESEGDESDADRIRRNDKSLTDVVIYGDWETADAVEILDALKNNSVVKQVFIYENRNPGLQLQLHQALVKLSEVMKCNTSVEYFSFFLRNRLLDERNQL